MKKFVIKNKIFKLQTILLHGCKRLNWTSLGTQDFIINCSKALDLLENRTSQYLKNFNEIQSIIKTVKNFNLLDFIDNLDSEYDINVIKYLFYSIFLHVYPTCLRKCTTYK